MVLNSQNMIKITVNVMYFKALLEVCTNRVWSTKKLIVKVNKSPNKEPNLFGIVERKTSLMFVKFVFTYYFRLLCIIIFACVHLLFFPSFSYRKKRTETLSLRAWELCAHVFFFSQHTPLFNFSSKTVFRSSVRVRMGVFVFFPNIQKNLQLRTTKQSESCYIEIERNLLESWNKMPKTLNLFVYRSL